MAIKITQIKLSGGHGHEHITHLWYVDQVNQKPGDDSRAGIVAWIENDGGKAFVLDNYGNRADVYVRTPTYGAKYLQTRADGVWTDNLLALPKHP